ncbi:hypothetical protein C882_1664 [Caenispirillum salinarum AK4]|uniref:Uncharacterized protein n=1 Tax=Caenispirillum salinarum AK4 TaxID=1238182 RepID=K9HXC2_9PROT|nr:hypothetical protein [Caenispirillum salinarum]EKV32826.1 hypothetical protein C882_1664 [Caenispirillum salinarum AK4]
MPKRSVPRRRARRKPGAGASVAAAALALSLAGAVTAPSGARADDGGGDPFDTAAVSTDALGEARGNGLSVLTDGLLETRVGVVLWDEVPKPPRRPQPRNAGGGGGGASSTAPNTLSLHFISNLSPGD